MEDLVIYMHEKVLGQLLAILPGYCPVSRWAICTYLGNNLIDQ